LVGAGVEQSVHIPGAAGTRNPFETRWMIHFRIIKKIRLIPGCWLVGAGVEQIVDHDDLLTDDLIGAS